MGNGIEVRFEYGGMRLICDDDALVRLREHICKETSVAEAIGGVSEASSVRFISVRPQVVESASPGIPWYKFIPAVIVNCLMIPVWIAGFVTVFRWIMRQLA
jgi:hypothetical protein